MNDLRDAIMELVVAYMKKRGVGEPWDHEQVMTQVVALEASLGRAHLEVGLLAERLDPILEPIEGLHLVHPDKNERLVPWEVRTKYTGLTPPGTLPQRVYHSYRSTWELWQRIRSLVKRCNLASMTPEGG